MHIGRHGGLQQAGMCASVFRISICTYMYNTMDTPSPALYGGGRERAQGVLRIAFLFCKMARLEHSWIY